MSCVRASSISSSVRPGRRCQPSRSPSGSRPRQITARRARSCFEPPTRHSTRPRQQGVTASSRSTSRVAPPSVCSSDNAAAFRFPGVDETGPDHAPSVSESQCSRCRISTGSMQIPVPANSIATYPPVAYRTPNGRRPPAGPRRSVRERGASLSGQASMATLRVTIRDPAFTARVGGEDFWAHRTRTLGPGRRPPRTAGAPSTERLIEASTEYAAGTGGMSDAGGRGGGRCCSPWKP